MKIRISEDMKTAMRAKDSKTLGVIRLLMAAIKQREVDERIVLEDPQIIDVLNTMLKQRRGSIVEFEKAKRDDLVQIEQFEIDLLQQYLPQQLSDEEIAAIVKQAVTDSGASSVKDMGSVMAILKPKMHGKADMGKVGAMIKQLLA